MNKILLYLYPGKAKRLFFTARFCCCLFLLAGISGYASALSQSQLVNLSMKKTTLRDVIWELQKQTDVVFVYNTADVQEVQVPEISVSKKSVKEVLDLCLHPVNTLQYEIADDVVIIRRVIPVVRQPQPETRLLTGKVTDTGRQPLAGVAIMVQGTSIGVVSDGQGNYQLSLPPGEAHLVIFSMLGYTPARIPYTGQAIQNVTLEEANNHMDEVIVTGYQKIERRALTAAISSVDMQRIGHVNQPSIDKLLQGQVAGMTIVNTSGSPGALPQIRIKGTATISGSVQPLWVVDGMILDDPVNVDISDLITNRNLISSGIGGVNVDDIESINILKDAAATALYGTRAGNGVIVITTRTGQIGRPQVRYNASIFVNERPRIKDAYMMNSKERIGVNFEMIDLGIFSPGSYGPGQYTNASDFEKFYLDVVDGNLSWGEFEQKIKALETTNTNWFKHLFRNAVTHRHNIDVNGGTETIKYYASASFMDEQATAIGAGQKTYTGTLKTDIRLYDNLKLIAKLNVSARDNDSFLSNDSWENPYDYALYTTRAHRAYDENGEPNYMYRHNQKFNYMENREHAWRQSKNFAFTAHVALEWNILKDLHFRTSLSVMKQNTTDVDIATEDSYFVRLRKYNFNQSTADIWNDGGWRKDRSINGRSLTLTSFISYMPVINDLHRFDVTFGNEIKDTKSLRGITEAYGYAHNRGHQMIPQWDLIKSIGRPYWTEHSDRAATLSFYGVLGYTYKNRYTASFNWRTDASNGFGLKTNKQVNPIWAVGLNYQVKEESFLKDADWLSFLTLRGSYGIQGNLPSQAYSDVVASFTPSDGINPDAKLSVTYPKNPGLKWEKIKSTNLALEFGLFEHRITAVLEYYKRHTVDALGHRSVSQVTGFNRLQVNWASIRNKGWEITLNTINIKNRNFRWTTNFNFARNENEVVSVATTPTWQNLTNSQRTDYASAAMPGYPLEGLWSFHYAGLNSEGRAQFWKENPGGAEITDENREDFLVLRGMSNIEGLVYSGSMVPPMQGGFTNTFTYKNLSLQTLLVGSFGNKIRLRNLSSQSAAFGYPDPTQNLSREWTYRWAKPGDEAFTDVPRMETYIWNDDLSYPYPANATMYDRSTLRTVSGNFVRLQNVSLTYELFSEKFKRVGIHSLRFMLQGNNLHIWHTSKLKGQDPEATGQTMNYTASNVGPKSAIDMQNTFLPLPRSYSLSVSVQF